MRTDATISGSFYSPHEVRKMGNVIIILILALLFFLGVRRIYRTIRYGGSCCSSSGGLDKKVRVSDHNKANYPFSYKLRVDGMVCAGCARKVENALNSGDGMWAKVDLEHKEVHVLTKKEMSRNDFSQLLKGTPYTLMEMF